MGGGVAEFELSSCGKPISGFACQGGKSGNQNRVAVLQFLPSKRQGENSFGGSQGGRGTRATYYLWMENFRELHPS